MISYGTYNLTGYTCFHNVVTAIKLGYRKIDTADLYKNQKDVGLAIIYAIENFGLTRSDLFITTKVHRVNSIYSDVLRCLKELQLDYIDLVLLHRPNCISGYSELINLKEQGFISNVGVSNFNIKQLNSTFPKPYLNQVELSIFNQKTELIEYCQKHNIIVEAHTCFAEGCELVSNIPNFHKLTLSWLHSRKINILVGSTNVEHMIENLSFSNFECDYPLDIYDVGYKKFKKFS